MTTEFLNTTKTSYLIGNVLWSYNTPVAEIVGNRLLVDNVKYSRTTSKQITQCANRLGLQKVYVDELFTNRSVTC